MPTPTEDTTRGATEAGASDSSAVLPETAGDVTSQITETLQGTVVAVARDFVAHLPLMVASVVVLLATWGLVTLFRRFSHRILAGTEVRGSLRDLFERLIVIALWSFGLVLAAMVLFPGLTPAKALGGLGLASVAVGFAFKDIFENFFAGILILWRFPFEKGDFIECQGILGRVEDITIRMTQIRRPSEELIVVPNGFLFRNPVQILTDKENRRMMVTTGVAYGEDVDHSIDVIERALESCDSVPADPSPQVFAAAFGASSIDIEIAWWTDPTPLGERRSRGEVVSAVKRALDEAGIEIPFPYRTLTFKEPLPIRPLQAPTRESLGNGAGATGATGG